jgi:two-component system OmpR family sensor kinase
VTRALRIDSVRARLTAFYVVVLAVALLIVGGLIYVLLARALYTRIDDGLRSLLEIATTSLANDLGEGQDVEDAARSTAAELSSTQQMLAIYDESGRLLAEGGRDDDLQVELPDRAAVPSTGVMLLTVVEREDNDDRHRLALRRVHVAGYDARYIVVGGSPLEPTDEELESLRDILTYVVPLALLIAGAGGWFLARQSLAPVVAMVDRAREMSAGNLSGRLPVANPRDEIGRLAETFNDLLSRLEASMTAQRQFMADASHELRTPVATTRTAANVALQQARREEHEYRDTLAVIEQQAARLSRIVDDMFTLARADTGSYPVHRGPLYLDEVVDEVARAARVLAAGRQVEVRVAPTGSASFTGDEELLRRMVANLLDNATRHAPPGSAVEVGLAAVDGSYEITVTDRGPGSPQEIQGHIFERFYRGDPRARADGGAGLGLALARWIAGIHGGDVFLARSSEDGTAFVARIRG